MSESIARYYDSSKNPGTEASPASIPGVPLTDLDQATWNALPEHVQRDINASPMYRKTKLPTRVRSVETPEPASDSEPEKEEA